MKIRFLVILGVFTLTGFILSGCNLRAYDYLNPAWSTFSASYRETTTPTATIQMVPTFTPLFTASATPSATSTATRLPPTVTATATLPEKPPAGEVSVMLENRTPYTIYVRLQGKQDQVFELAAAEAQPVAFAAGVYEYWIILPERASLHGQKVFSPGFSTWTFYDTPGVVESPTPWNPGFLH